MKERTAMVIDKVLDAITDVEIALEENDTKTPRSDKGIRAKRDEGNPPQR